MPRKLGNWKEHPDEEHYKSAANYLSLILPPASASRIATRFRRAPLEHWLAKDLIRASRLGILPADNYNVAKNLRKVKAGKKLAPVLLVRGQAGADLPLTIADGYHRICASWHLDEETLIPCRMVDLEAGSAADRAAVKSSRGGGSRRAARRSPSA